MREIKLPGLTLNEVFDRVRAAVYQASVKQQLPWTSSSVIGSFIFRDPGAEEQKVKAEVARLEARLKELEREEAEAKSRQSEQQAKDKAKQAEAVRSRLEFEQREQERLKKEADQRQALLAVDRTAADRGELRKSEEARLAELRRKADEQQGAAGEAERGQLIVGASPHGSGVADAADRGHAESGQCRTG